MGRRPDVVADVVIETEHAVWTLMLCGDDLRHVAAESVKGDFASQVIDATSWPPVHAVVTSGSCHISPVTRMLEWRWSNGTFRSRDSLQLRSDTRGNALSNVRGIGSVRWTDLAAILRDCEQAGVLTNIERALARNAVTWLEQVGIG